MGWGKGLGAAARAEKVGGAFWHAKTRPEQGANRLSDELQEECQGTTEKVEAGRELPAVVSLRVTAAGPRPARPPPR